MRTKTVLLSALFGLASAAALMAQTQVYSLNAVGYVNLTIPAGWSTFCNPLNSTNNSITNLLPAASLPISTRVFWFNGAAYDSTSVDTDDYSNPIWLYNSQPVGGANMVYLNPGRGYIIHNMGAPFTVTFVGEVPQGTNLTVGLQKGFTLASSIVPQAFSVTNLSFATIGDRVFKMVNGLWLSSNLDTDDYNNPLWMYNGQPVSDANPFGFNVAEGFYYLNNSSSSNSWVRNFSVNN